MKAEYLKILRDNNINVPPFIVADTEEKVCPDFSDSAFFAVRSSFETEDSEQASFAGQFDTFLNVPRAQVDEYVRRVRASAGNINVKEYVGAKENVSIADVGTCGKRKCAPVIVQEMIDADYAGVLFTANPLGILNEMVIVAGFGLGSGVVEDKTETSAYYYNCDDEIYCSSVSENTPKLSDAMIGELVAVGRRVRDIFRKEMDIEYAVKGEKLYILQARPITTLVEGTPIILDNSNIVESYPYVTLPLTQSCVKRVYYRVFRSCVWRVSRNAKLVERLEGNLQHMTDVADGRIYYRISNWYAVLKMLPFSKKIIRIWQSMLGVSNQYVPDVDIKVGAGAKLWIALSFGVQLVRTPANMRALNAFFAEKYPDYCKKLLDTHEKEKLLALYEELLEALSSRWDITLMNDMYAFLFTALAGKNNKETIANIKNLESMKPVKKMEELIAIARKKGMSDEAYLAAAAEYVEVYGDRALGELKLETRTYRTDEELLHRYVEQNLSEEGGDAPSHPAEPIPDKARRNVFVKRAKRGIYHREISRMNRTRIFGLARSILLEVGEIMAAGGMLAEARDVFYLYYEELKEDVDRKALVEIRKAEYARYRLLPTFSRLVYADKVRNHDIFCVGYGALRDNDGLRGIPSSPGGAEGEILVIENPSLDIDTSGKIIVTKMTDPGWVFLLKNAKGIIAEKGSLLSHTAIIARELHKPAVVNVKDATRLLKTGDKVKLDANEGVIYKV